jgi:hypothetical protein
VAPVLATVGDPSNSFRHGDYNKDLKADLAILEESGNVDYVIIESINDKIHKEILKAAAMLARHKDEIFEKTLGWDMSDPFVLKGTCIRMAITWYNSLGYLMDLTDFNAYGEKDAIGEVIVEAAARLEGKSGNFRFFPVTRDEDRVPKSSSRYPMKEPTDRFFHYHSEIIKTGKLPKFHDYPQDHLALAESKTLKIVDKIEKNKDYMLMSNLILVTPNNRKVRHSDCIHIEA